MKKLIILVFILPAIQSFSQDFSTDIASANSVFVCGLLGEVDLVAVRLAICGICLISGNVVLNDFQFFWVSDMGRVW
jgi:hypothetical protein